MTESAASSRIALCASQALAERGDAWVFDVLLWGRPARAFALRFEGRVVGYLNRCVHVAAEMDWQPGRFLDTQKRWIVCALHGATFEPSDGYCIAGPGRGQRRVRAREAGRLLEATGGLLPRPADRWPGPS